MGICASSDEKAKPTKPSQDKQQNKAQETQGGGHQQQQHQQSQPEQQRESKEQGVAEQKETKQEVQGGGTPAKSKPAEQHQEQEQHQIEREEQQDQLPQQQQQQQQEQQSPQGRLQQQQGETSTAGTSNTNTSSSGEATSSAWDRARQTFALTRPEELFDDLHDLKYIGAGGYGKVFKAVWRSAPVAVKLVPSSSPELFKSSSYKEALLCKELCHPNIVQTYETRCARITEEFVRHVLEETESQGTPSDNGSAPLQGNGSREFVSGDGFGLPSPVPDMLVRGRTLPGAAAKWKDILLTTGAKAGDFLTVIIMDFCDYGSLVRPILKGMFRPVSASGNDREARVRYRALLRTAKEIAQGIEHLHHLRVVHGDLKPGNVLLKGSRVDVRGFNAQVIDFGLSHLVSSSNPQKVSKAGGTLVYAAPEVFSGIVGKAADIYSLGIIIWEMTTGSQPYKDLVEGQIVLGVQKHGLRPPWPADQLPQLQEVYNMCVAQDAEARPKAKQLVQMLTKIEMDLRMQLKDAHNQLQEERLRQQQQQQMLQQANPASQLVQQQQNGSPTLPPISQPKKGDSPQAAQQE
ncbi:kinase-like domain-containing protein [Dunaliella salina]|uniref:Kinase-like domain-containing protein n=1 Tax=Dunaliella salina TaxID=3046 RepID=A0ABQ7GMF8_DUNSA|nr:kinase-like domain-containing protein [Dunaliella salina]|eukprot:KAF5835794.1 kinase-like domain-containing protein [Dunaliella salina]